MKRITAILLCILLALSCSLALAEEDQKENYTEVTINGAFRIRGATPEGYQVEEISNEALPIRVFFSNEDQAKPYFHLIINFREDFADVDRLNDMSEEDRQMLLGEDAYISEEIKTMETDYGTQVMVLRSAIPDDDFACFVTLYKGYEVGLNLFPGLSSDGKLTDDQIALAMKFLSDLDFVPIGE